VTSDSLQGLGLQLLHDSFAAVLRPSLRGRVSAWPQTEQPSISKCTQWVGLAQPSHGSPRRLPIEPKPGALQLGQRRSRDRKSVV
jgi:hypothetical protein